MRVAVLVLGFALLQGAALVARATDRAHVKQEAVGAAKAAKYGEAEAPSAPPSKATAAEKQAAKATRRQEGSVMAKTHPVGEGNPVSEPRAKVPKEERATARADRKAETRRANKAGEITSKGEAGS